MGLPVSDEIIRAASSVRRTISSAIVCMASARVKAGVVRHCAGPPSAAAAASAASTPAAAAAPSASSAATLLIAAVAPPAAPCHPFPPNNPTSADITQDL